jgi:hypothetical protein
MANIVQQGGESQRLDELSALARKVLSDSPVACDHADYVCGPDRVCEAVVSGSREDEIDGRELADASEPLKLWRVDEVHLDLRQPNPTVNRVVNGVCWLQLRR